MFIYLNRNKRGVTLDIESDVGRALAADLFAEADVLMESFPPGYMDSLGFAYKFSGRAQSQTGTCLDHALRSDRPVA